MSKTTGCGGISLEGLFFLDTFNPLPSPEIEALVAPKLRFNKREKLDVTCRTGKMTKLTIYDIRYTSTRTGINNTNTMNRMFFRNRILYH